MEIDALDIKLHNHKPYCGSWPRPAVGLLSIKEYASRRNPRRDLQPCSIK
jgi:hypothetical protein